MNILLYRQLKMCMHIKFQKSDIHIHNFIFSWSLKWHVWISISGQIPPSLQKSSQFFQFAQISAFTSYSLVGFRLIQNFFRIMESSEERSRLKQRNKLLPMGRRWTWAAFTLCDTLDFCRAIKNWSCFLELKLPFFSCKLKVCPQVSHRPGYASIQGCVSW